MKTKLFLSILLAHLFLLINGYAQTPDTSVIASAKSQSNIVELRRFDAIRISPFIEVILEAGEQEQIEILSSEVSERNLRYYVNGRTLEVYLQGAKYFPRDLYGCDDWEDDNYAARQDLYKAQVKITYRQLEKLVVMGDETVRFTSPWQGRLLSLRSYGDNEIIIPSVEAKYLKVALYGDTRLTIEGGTLDQQHLNMYGDAEVYTLGLESYEVTANVFGDNYLQVQAIDELRIFGFGDFEIQYAGNPLIRKSLSLGDYDIQRIGD